MANILCNILFKLLIVRMLLILIGVTSFITQPAISLASISLAGTSSPSLIANSSPVIVTEKIKATVGIEGINRLHFNNYPIAQIIGDESKYSFFTGRDNKNLFLAPYFAAGEKAELTIIDVAGRASDIELVGSNGSGRTISIPNPSLKQYKARKYFEDRKQIKEMMQAMILNQNIDDKYYIRHKNRKIDFSSIAGLSIIQDQTYRYDDLIGVRLIVSNNKSTKHNNKNKSCLLNRICGNSHQGSNLNNSSFSSEGVIKLDKADFKNLFKSVVAVRMKQNTLVAGKQTIVWLIAKTK